jgi:hypothetical protein
MRVGAARETIGVIGFLSFLGTDEFDKQKIGQSCTALQMACWAEGRLGGSMGCLGLGQNKITTCACLLFNVTSQIPRITKGTPGVVRRSRRRQTVAATTVHSVRCQKSP